MENTKKRTNDAKQATEGRKKTAAPKTQKEQMKANEAKFAEVAAKLRDEKREAEEAKKAASIEKYRAEAAALQALANEPKTAEKAEERNEKTMKNEPKKNAAPKTEEAPKTAEEVKTEAAEPKTESTATMIRRYREAAKTGSTADKRKEAAEKAADLTKKYNADALANAVKLASFSTAAEALKPSAPKKAEAKKAGFTYADDKKLVTYVQIDEEGNENKRVLSLVTFAAEAFTKTASAEAAKLFAEALAALDIVAKNAAEEKHEGGKEAAATLTALAKACGLEGFVTKKTAEGVNVGFYVDRSFVYNAEHIKARRGEGFTTAAKLEKAKDRALNASFDRRTKAEEAAEKAEKRAIKFVFGIIAEAAEAAAVNVWKKHIKTAEDVKREAEEAAEERARREALKAAKKAESDKEKAAKLRKKISEAAAKLAALEEANPALYDGEAEAEEARELYYA